MDIAGRYGWPGWVVALLGFSALGIDAAICNNVTVQGELDGVYLTVNDGNFMWMHETQPYGITFEDDVQDTLNNCNTCVLNFTGTWGDEALSYACSDRAWYIYQETLGVRDYPIWGVLDCADDPSELTSVRWREFACEDCVGENRNSTITVACNVAEDDDIVDNDEITTSELSECTSVAVEGEFAGTYTVVANNNETWLHNSEDYTLRKEVDVQEKLNECTDCSLNFTETWGSGATSYACSDEAWYLYQREGGVVDFPIYGVLDCAKHPADMTSIRWMEFACSDCEGVERTSDITVTCLETEDNDDDEVEGGNQLEEGGVNCISMAVTGPSELAAGGFKGGEFTWNGRDDEDGIAFGSRIFKLEGSDTSQLQFIDSGAGDFFEGYEDLLDDDMYTCTSGAWAFVDSGDDDDLTIAMDCTEHPLGITTIWYRIPCLNCQPLVSTPQPELECIALEGQSTSDDDMWKGRPLTDSGWAALWIGIVIVMIACCLGFLRLCAWRLD